MKLLTSISDPEAKCRVCQLRIDPNNVRIGVPIYHSAGMGIDLHHSAGVSHHWFHLLVHNLSMLALTHMCLHRHHAVCCLVAQRSPDARSKCRHCKKKVEKGCLRLGVRGPTMKSTAWTHLPCVRHMFDHEQLREAGIDVSKQLNPWWVMGYGTLSLSDKLALTAVLGENHAVWALYP